MKKSLLSFFMLILCIGILSSKTFAQDAPGTSGGTDGMGVDGGIAGPVIYSAPPSYAGSVKRNNGNGTTQNGFAEVRLSVSTSFTGDVTLTDVRYLTNSSVSLGAVGNNGYGSHEKGYLSYELIKNVIPAKKLLFFFRDSYGNSFCIPEN